MSWQQAVYDVVRTIPAGKVLGYGHVATILGEPRKARHVGFALAALDPDTKVPWWRVTRSNGDIALRGDPIRGTMQRTLLTEEGVTFRNDRVDMAKHRWEP